MSLFLSSPSTVITLLGIHFLLVCREGLEVIVLQTELQCIISRYNDSVLYRQTASSVHRSYYLLHHTGSEDMCYTEQMTTEI